MRYRATVEKEDNELEDCLVELPPFGSFPVKSFRRVIEPVCTEQDLDEMYPCATVVFDFDVA